MRIGWVPPILTASLLVACGSGPASHRSAAQPVRGTPPSVVVSVGHSPRLNDPPPQPGHLSGAIDLRRVVLRAGPKGVVATFTTYSRMHLTWMKSATACGQVGIYLRAQHLLVSSSPREETDIGETAVAHNQVAVRFLGPRVVRLKVPLAALGSPFTTKEPWNGYSLGYVCPPGGQQVDLADVVTPGT